jgi:hypothetical protein
MLNSDHTDVQARDRIATDMNLEIMYIVGLDTGRGIGNVRTQLSQLGFETRHILNISTTSKNVVETVVMKEHKERIRVRVRG